jgi:hypothetical protein
MGRYNDTLPMVRIPASVPATYMQCPAGVFSMYVVIIILALIVLGDILTALLGGNSSSGRMGRFDNFFE